MNADPPLELGTITGDDASHYFGYILGLTLNKFTNGMDVDQEPGPVIIVGKNVEWAYQVENTGNVTLTDLSIVDDNGTSEYPDDDLQVSCPAELTPGEPVTCFAEGTVVEGQYSNTASARAVFDKDSAMGNQILQASDTSYYFGKLGYEFFIPLLLR